MKEKTVDEILSGYLKSYLELVKRVASDISEEEYNKQSISIVNQAKQSIWQLIDNELDKQKWTMSMGLSNDVKRHNEVIDDCKDALHKLIMGEK